MTGAITTVSGLLALTTAILYAARFFERRQIADYDVVADIGGHFLHGVFMSYMAAVMLGASAAFGWNWITYLFGALAVLFLIRAALVARVKVFGFKSIFKFERHTKWWWDPLHATNHLAMAYMFCDMALWQEHWTYLAIANSILILFLYAKKTAARFGQKPGIDRTFAFYSDVGHMAMALSMTIMFSVMQWGETGMDHPHDHSSMHMAMGDQGDDRTQIVTQIQRQFGTPQIEIQLALSGNWAVAGWSHDGQESHGLLQKTEDGWFVYLCGDLRFADVDALTRAGVGEYDASSIVKQLEDAKHAMPPEKMASQGSFNSNHHQFLQFFRRGTSARI